MKRTSLLIITFVLPVILYCQAPNRIDLLKNRVKKILVTNNDSFKSIRSYDNKGLLQSEIDTPFTIIGGNSKHEINYYYKDTLLIKETSTTKKDDSVISFTTNIYQYDSLGRKESDLYFQQGHSDNEELTLYQYYQHMTGWIEREFQVYQKSTYWVDSNGYGKKPCDYVYKNGKQYYLRDYEINSYWSNNLIPDVTQFFCKYSTEKKRPIQTFCNSLTQQKINLGDTLVEYITTNTGNSDAVPEKVFACDSVTELANNASINKIVIEKLRNGKKYETIVKDFSQSPYDATVIYSYNDKGLLDKVITKTGYSYGISKQIFENTCTYTYEYWPDN